MPAPVASGDNNVQKQIENFWDEYINLNTLSPFMGGEMDVIHVKDDLSKGDGDKIHYTLLDAMDPDTPLYGQPTGFR